MSKPWIPDENFQNEDNETSEYSKQPEQGQSEVPKKKQAEKKQAEIKILETNSDGSALVEYEEYNEEEQKQEKKTKILEIRGLKLEHLYCLAPLEIWEKQFGVENSPPYLLERVKSWLVQGKGGVRLKVYSSREMPRVAPSYIVDKIIPEKAYGFLFADSGVGKSYLAIALATSVVSGKPFLGRFPVKKGSVLYLAGEDPDGLLPRIDASFNRLSDGQIKTPEDHPKGFDILPEEFSLVDRLDEIIEEAKFRNCKLVIVDTLNCYFQEDENSATEARRFNQAVKRLVRETGATVLVLHHTGKNQAAGMRGSTAFRAGADFVLRLERNKEDDIIRLTQEKNRNDVNFKPINLRLVPQGVGRKDDSGKEYVNAVIIELSDEAYRELTIPKEGTKARAVYDHLRKFAPNGDWVEDKAGSGFRKGLLFEDSEMDSQSYKQAKRQLLEKNLIKKRNGEIALKCGEERVEKAGEPIF